MSSRQREKPGRVMERADRNSHTGVALFLAHAEQDDPRQQLLPDDTSNLLEQAEYAISYIGTSQTNLG